MSQPKVKYLLSFTAMFLEFNPRLVSCFSIPNPVYDTCPKWYEGFLKYIGYLHFRQPKRPLEPLFADIEMNLENIYAI